MDRQGKIKLYIPYNSYEERSLMNKIKMLIPVIIFTASLLSGLHSLCKYGHESNTAEVTLISTHGLKRVADFVSRRASVSTAHRTISIEDYRKMTVVIYS